jgi:hypothetical protein
VHSNLRVRILAGEQAVDIGLQDGGGKLEAAGIVGPFEGSKARSVNILDMSSLDQFFNNEEA